MKPAIFVFATLLASSGSVLAQTSPTGPGAGTAIPNPSSSDAERNCAQAPQVSGCPGTGTRAMPNTSDKHPGNTEFLTSPTGMMTDSGAQPPANDGRKSSSESPPSKPGESPPAGSGQPSPATDRATLPPVSTPRTPPPK